MCVCIFFFHIYLPFLIENALNHMYVDTLRLLFSKNGLSGITWDGISVWNRCLLPLFSSLFKCAEAQLHGGQWMTWWLISSYHVSLTFSGGCFPLPASHSGQFVLFVAQSTIGTENKDTVLGQLPKTTNDIIQCAPCKGKTDGTVSFRGPANGHT